jgi:hypothetical protein
MKPTVYRSDGHHCDHCSLSIVAGSSGERCKVCDFDLCFSCAETAIVGESATISSDRVQPPRLDAAVEPVAQVQHAPCPVQPPRVPSSEPVLQPPAETRQQVPAFHAHISSGPVNPLRLPSSEPVLQPPAETRQQVPAFHAHISSGPVNPLRLPSSESVVQPPAETQLFPALQVEKFDRPRMMLKRKMTDVAVQTSVQDLPAALVTDVPVQPSPREPANEVAVQTSFHDLPVALVTDVAVQPSPHDPANETPLTLQNLRDEIRALLIGLGF